MTLLIKADEQQVYMNINGDVYSEHVNFLQDNLIERLHYGYRHIVLDVNDVRQFDDKGIAMLTYIRSKLHKLGGNLIINDKNGAVSDLVFADPQIL
ncbi:STAS domain-containing protein [Pelosinus sp. UFO1]|uniref:STAS domain-containing protein n=1 Tax=Pelosinus sp. UFO1 TaxID=484770 RepID=UPI0004D0BA7C|nr:STAS domain-containing protein [Pelosinus sp. UFO1]AIF50422.1 Sulfate transporter/antisigma-factor antagonist STAS [Pelosinus sp. UFO1]